MEWALLEVLTPEERHTLLQPARRCFFAKNEPVFHEGDFGDTLHLVSQGHVAVRITTSSGDTCILRIIGPGGWFGELAILAPAARNANVVALDRVVTVALRGKDIDDVRRRVPAFDEVLLEALVAEIRRLSQALLEAFFLPVERRVSRRLAELAELYAPGSRTALLPLTQEELAQIAGTTRPTVNKLLQSAAAGGIVALGRGMVEILDRSLLEQAAH